MLLIAEIFRNSEAREANAETRAGRLGHLSVDQRATRLFRIARRDDASFGHFKPKVVAFASAFTDAGKYREATMLHGDVVNQLKNQNCFADTGAAE